jgi:hypothetical protein
MSEDTPNVRKGRVSTGIHRAECEREDDTKIAIRTTEGRQLEKDEARRVMYWERK